MNCSLCQSKDCAQYPSFGSNLSYYECLVCGKFTISAEARSIIGDNGWKLAAYVWEQNRRGTNPVFFSSQNSINSGSPVGAVGIDAVLAAFPNTVAERLDRALLNLATVTKHLGQNISIPSEGANPTLLAQNSGEVFFIIQQFALDGFVIGNTRCLPTTIQLTAKGLNRVADLQRGLFGPLSKQTFVAMSFHESLDKVWTDGLRPGIEDCGYSPLRVDAKEHNEKICDVIIAEIRKSKFLVADFTSHRAGVYFEAGLMTGLGRPVIFTCHNDELSKAHFDTRQYNHISWSTPADLREKLKRRIEATIAL